ncbi:MAG: GGDEF domain-containing protein [Fuerstiella sp.]
MSTSKPLRSDPATIRVHSHDSSDAPLLVHRELLLRDLPAHDSHQYVLICDDSSQIVGVVPTSEINRRLHSQNLFERTRWAAMPIGAMSKLSFSETETESPVLNKHDTECTAIIQGDVLFGLAVEGELFFSWKRLESVFSAALSDPLTGLMNRMAYERRLEEEWNRSTRTGTAIGAVIVDLNDFKKINDTFGHVIGDQVLVEVGRQLEMSMRSYDVVARFGGDEFVALCLGCAPGDIDIPMKRLQESLAGISIKTAGRTITVSASIGAAVRHSGFDDTSPEDLFVAADNCLYEAKKSSSRSWRIEFGLETPGRSEPVSEVFQCAINHLDSYNN